jgi:hypothetical protein
MINEEHHPYGKSAKGVTGVEIYQQTLRLIGQFSTALQPWLNLPFKPNFN